MLEPSALRHTILQLLAAHQRTPDAPPLTTAVLTERLKLPLDQVREQLRVLRTHGQVSIERASEVEVVEITPAAVQLMRAIAGSLAHAY